MLAKISTYERTDHNQLQPLRMCPLDGGFGQQIAQTQQIGKDQQGWYMARKIFFERVQLTPYRQIVYDRTGNIATIADYANFEDHNGVGFPSHIEIERPQEEYKIGLSIVSLKLNQPLTPEQFELQPPPGAQVVHLTNGDGQTAEK